MGSSDVSHYTILAVFQRVHAKMANGRQWSAYIRWLLGVHFSQDHGTAECLRLMNVDLILKYP